MLVGIVACRTSWMPRMLYWLAVWELSFSHKEFVGLRGLRGAKSIPRISGASMPVVVVLTSILFC